MRLNRLPARYATVQFFSACWVKVLLLNCTPRTVPAILPLPRTYMRHAHLLRLSRLSFWKTPWACLDFALPFIYQDLSSFASAVSWLFRVNTSATILVADSNVGFLNFVSHSLIWRVFWLFIYKTRRQKQICNLFLRICIFWPSEPAR